MISLGALDRARTRRRAQRAAAGRSGAAGLHIVATEPSAALCLTHEYPMLLDDDDARLVAANTSEACHYLWQLHQAGKLQLDLQAGQRHARLPHAVPPAGAGQSARPGENLLRLIPGLIGARASTTAAPAWPARSA